jgi:hypothetical protein
MKHIELHVINNETDATQAEETGLTTFGVFEVCENCDEAIGYTPNGFYPCVIVLSVDQNDEDIEFLLCDACVSPILSPNYIN